MSDKEESVKKATRKDEAYDATVNDNDNYHNVITYHESQFKSKKKKNKHDKDRDKDNKNENDVNRTTQESLTDSANEHRKDNESISINQERIVRGNNRHQSKLQPKTKANEQHEEQDLEKIHERSKNSNVSDHHEKKVDRWEKKLRQKKEEYHVEKDNLKQKLLETKTRFEDEIKKYETDLKDKRNDYFSQLTDLQFDEQMQSMAARMEELRVLEDELDCRFKQCVDFELEIEQAEQYLDRRGEICKSREEELKNLDEELDELHKELELNKEGLQKSGVDVDTILTSKRQERFSQLNSSLRGGNDDENYIIESNLRRTQGELKTTQQNLDVTTEKLNQVMEELQHLQDEKKKGHQKVKHLETQLAIALGQLTQHSVASGSHQSQRQDRYKSVRNHIALNRLNEDSLLSVNQQAQLRRKESDRSSSSDGRMSRQSTSRKISRLTDQSVTNSRGSSEASGSVSGSGGDHIVNGVVSENGLSKSTTCYLM